MNEIFWVIVGTATSVATLVGAVGLWVLRAVVAQDIKPVGDTAIMLVGAVKALNTTLIEERESRKEERTEMQRIVHDLDILVRDLDRRTTRLEAYHPLPRG